MEDQNISSLCTFIDSTIIIMQGVRKLLAHLVIYFECIDVSITFTYVCLKTTITVV